MPSYYLEEMAEWISQNEHQYSWGQTPKQKWHIVRVLDVDGAYPLYKGKKYSVLIAVDLGYGQPMAIGQGQESNPHAVIQW